MMNSIEPELSKSEHGTNKYRMLFSTKRLHITNMEPFIRIIFFLSFFFSHHVISISINREQNRTRRAVRCGELLSKYYFRRFDFEKKNQRNKSNGKKVRFRLCTCNHELFLKLNPF